MGAPTDFQQLHHLSSLHGYGVCILYVFGSINYHLEFSPLVHLLDLLYNYNVHAVCVYYKLLFYCPAEQW